MMMKLNLSAMLVAATLVGCGQNDVQVYRVAKEQQAAQSVPASGGSATDAAEASPRLQWKLPAGWKEVPPGEMRVASFAVAGPDGKKADVSVVPLPGLAGGDLGNVNRWRSQIGQPPITEQDLAKEAQSVEVAGQAAQLYDQAGVNPGSGEKARILGAIQRREGVAWFFKMTGDDELVAQQKPAFVEFLKSLTFPATTGGTAAAAVTQADLPPSHPPVGGSLATAPASADLSSAEGRPVWQVPAGWKEVPGGQFLIAKFVTTDTDNSQAAINVSMSAGDGGGLAGNVNRWRGQLGLGQLSESAVNQLIRPVDIPGGKAMLVDMAGVNAKTSQKERLIGAIVPQAKQTWFYKLMGNDKLVEREREAFTQFVQTARYSHAP
jgi:hypothetical protein